MSEMKRLLPFIILLAAVALLLFLFFSGFLLPYPSRVPVQGSDDGKATAGNTRVPIANQEPLPVEIEDDPVVEDNALVIPVIELESDKDEDGLKDLADIVEGARLDVQNKPRYKDGYYSGGYPPDDEGVCTDVVWRAFKNAGYLLKDMIDEDIRNHTELYPRVGGRPDPNIDFRRIQNLIVFFRRYAETLTTELIPGDTENLYQWQGGDIIIFLEPYEHIGILSDKRDEDGVPYLIHNGGPYTKEENALPWYLDAGYEIAWHFRFPKLEGSEEVDGQ